MFNASLLSIRGCRITLTLSPYPYTGYVYMYNTCMFCTYGCILRMSVSIMNFQLTLYDPGGGFKSPPSDFLLSRI